MDESMASLSKRRSAPPHFLKTEYLREEILAPG